MKVSKKSKLFGGSQSNSESESSGSHGVASWAVVDPSKFKSIAKEAKFQNQRAPEFWVKQDERKPVFFVDGDAVASFNVYRVPLGGRNYGKFVQPAPGEPDLFSNVLDLRPTRMFLFRVIDIDGYTGKKGPVKNVPRFYLVGSRQYEQIVMIPKITGIALNKQIIVVARSGSGTNTVYTYIPRPGSMSSAVRKVIDNFPKWKDFYRPLSQKEQRAIVDKVDTSGGDNNEE